MKRLILIITSLFFGIILIIPLLLIAIIIKTTSKGPIMYWSDRVGRNNIIFRMPKFRTMVINAPVIATHLLGDPVSHLTPVGSFLRKSSLDELPQIWSVLMGHMAFVGPRPALFNQYDLIALRTRRNVHQLLPGVTGWAQINGRDELSIDEKVALDVIYLNNASFWFDVKIIGLTLQRVIKREGVSH
jgi:O-antigen biosynthesis protein WbqP